MESSVAVVEGNVASAFVVEEVVPFQKPEVALEPSEKTSFPFFAASFAIAVAVVASCEVVVALALPSDLEGASFLLAFQVDA